MRATGAAGLTLVLAAVLLPPTAHARPRLHAPASAATAVPVKLRATGLAPAERVWLDLRRDGEWRRIRRGRAGEQGRERFRFRRSAPARYRFRLRTRQETSRRRSLRIRHVTLAAVGDINLGNGPRAVMRYRGVRYPWRTVAATLRGADVALGNLECAVSRRGRPVPKMYNFRGGPGALRAAARYAGLDVVNLANNHVGDYGRRALLDTIRFSWRFGLTPVGAGRDLEAARTPRVIERLGLRIAFVGFSDILPYAFAATEDRPGTAFATTAAIRRAVRRARRRADVVVATFHWGTERSHRPHARQRLFARTALEAGAAAVIGAHPHVLQPREWKGRQMVAYSLGNFVWSAGSAATTRTGILMLKLSGRGVEGGRLRPARIVNTQPRLHRRRH